MLSLDWPLHSVNFLRDSNPRWSPLQLTEVSIGKEMICQMLFNNNIVHKFLKVIQIHEQYRLSRTSGYLSYCVEKTILIFLKQKIWTSLKTMFIVLVSENSWWDLHVESLIQNLWNIFFSITLTFASIRLTSQNPFFQRKTMIFPQHCCLHVNTARAIWLVELTNQIARRNLVRSHM